MKTFSEDFMLPPESSIQDAFEGIAHWRKVIAVGTKYSISINGTYVRMKASWPKGSALGGLNPFIPLISRVDSQFRGDQMSIDFKFTEMINGIHVNALLSGAIDRGMGDYRNLKTHLLARSGVPDRAFDRYLTEQTKKPETPIPEDKVGIHQDQEPELRNLEESVADIQQGPTQNCPHCASEISISGNIRPGGVALCPTCHKKFLPKKI